ncbi:ATP-binding cassette domain-containing protein [uncultured Ferrimonas sp.]|uniref:ATP-binding cassette domain-containing protein n=1 Tax=uncultured Ferrimonas sp. TaxID=432640 RepID=UPI00261DE3B0|nr:ATP-binding cassette domain-containing protein [uncultured Ferrimonas sp.]
MPTQTALALNNLTVERNHKAILAQISLTIATGETVALVGESGAGKSTLLAQLRHYHPDHVAWCPQAPALVPMLSLYHNVYMGQLHQRSAWRNLRNLFKPHRADQQAITELATMLELLNGDPARLHQSAERFSGGEQQRIGIARALYQRRPIFLGDEPVSAIDELHAQTVIAQIKAAHDTVVLALHDVELALHSCDRIIGMQQGRIVLDAPSADLTPADLLKLYPSGRPQ